MLNKTFIYTSIMTALFMTISLSMLKLFDFIKWSPIGWSNKWSLFSSFHVSINWVILFLSITVIFAIIYIVTSYLDAIAPALLAITIGILGIVGLEWLISEPKSPIELIKSVSVPMLSVTAIALRIITGTSVFMKRLSRKV